MSDCHPTSGCLTRRDFLRSSALTTVGLSAGLSAAANYAHAAGSDTLRVGLIGCGSRGTGAARDAVMAAQGVEIVAMGDLFQDRLTRSRELLREAIGSALKVDDGHAFVGFDSYRRVIESGVDLVILATPPAFRPLHFSSAVNAGVHVFMEKPVAVDVAGIREILEAGEAARRKRLSVVAGTVYRRQPNFVEAVARIHDGAIGELVGGQAYYLTGALRRFTREPEMSDMEWQIRAWWYYTWLSGDHVVEQFVHNLDIVNWVFGNPPESALGMGGRIARTDPAFDVYDHFSVEYVYSDGVRVEAKCRQMANCARRIANRIVGTTGVADLDPRGSWIRSHSGELLFEYLDSGGNPYVRQHADLTTAIRTDEPINEARQLAESTLTGIMGRESAYTGRELSWEEILAADQQLVPRDLTFGPTPFPLLAIPGRTELNRSPWTGNPGRSG